MQEKMSKVTRTRWTERQFVAIQTYMELDGRERFEEAVRHLVDVGLKAKMQVLSKMQGVEGCETVVPRTGYFGPERRRGAQKDTPIHGRRRDDA